MKPPYLTLFLCFLCTLAFADQSSPALATSSTAQQLFSASQNDLLQIRVLLINGRSQASIGSGFLIQLRLMLILQ